MRCLLIAIACCLAMSTPTISADLEPIALGTIHGELPETPEPPTLIVKPQKKTLTDKLSSPKVMKTATVVNTLGGALLTLIQLGWYVKNWKLPSIQTSQ